MKNNNPDVISLKELILIVKDNFFEILKYWWQIGLITMPFLLYYGYKAIYPVPEYTATVRFMLEGSKKGLGGLGSILGNIGLGGTNESNPYKVIEVAKSDIILSKVVFDSCTYKREILANDIIEEYELDKLWSKNNDKYENFRFKNRTLDKLDTLEKAAYKQIKGTVLGRGKTIGLVKVYLDHDTGIFYITCDSKSEGISLDLSNKIFDSIKELLEDRLNENDIKTRKIFFNKRDSLKALIDYKSLQLARFEDRNRGALSSLVKVKKTDLVNEIRILSAAYGEVTKTYEITDYNARNREPLFMVIDKPFSPLLPKVPSLLINLIIGLILGSFIGIVFVLLRKIYREAMEGE